MTRRWTRLDIFATVGGTALAALAIWAYTQYETIGIGLLVRNLTVGVLVIALPRGVSRAKLTLRRVWEHYADTEAGESNLFKSTERVSDVERALDAVAESFAGDDDRSVTRKSFSEGPGLVITHEGFHNSFVRRLKSGHLVVTGDGDRTSALADRVERVAAISLVPTTPSRVASPNPLRGPTRVTVGLLVFVLLLAGITGIAGGAYPSDTYNPAEKVVLVSFDARTDFDPTMSSVDGRLGKSAFLVDVLREEAVEIRVANGSDRIRDHAEQSLTVSCTADQWLTEVREESRTSTHRARIERIRTKLQSARDKVANAITERIDDESVAETERLRQIRAALTCES